MRVSPTEYRDATRIAMLLVSILYFVAGGVAGLSTRHFELTGFAYMAALLAVIVLCNGIILLLQRATLPGIERQLQAAIAVRDGTAFARHIIRREMAKIIQPVGGITLTIGFLAEIIAFRLWHESSQA